MLAVLTCAQIWGLAQAASSCKAETGGVRRLPVLGSVPRVSVRMTPNRLPATLCGALKQLRAAVDELPTSIPAGDDPPDVLHYGA